MRAWVSGVAWLVLALGCSSKDADTGRLVDTGEPTRAAGVLRLGPPAPAVGIYGVAADQGRVFVSNLHVPFVTIVDGDQGTWADALDLRELGLNSSFFPQLFTTDTHLWITSFDTEQLAMYTLDSLSPVGLVTLDSKPAGVDAVDDGLWVSLQDGRLVRLNGKRVEESVEVGLWATALDVGVDADGEAVFGMLDANARNVSWVDRTGAVSWTTELALWSDLNDVAVVGDYLAVVDRGSGELLLVSDEGVVDKRVTGSDTFGVESFEGDVLVVNRQGHQLPASGAYEGAPGTVTRLDMNLDTVWQAEMGKTIHFLAWDDGVFWTVNEDSLNVSAFEPETGEVILHGPPLGLTIDHLSSSASHWWFGSHLTDEVWAVDGGQQALEGGASASVDAAGVCGWPFVTVPIDETLWVPCQEDGSVHALSTSDLSVVDTTKLVETFHPSCEGGLCTGHAQFVSATAFEDQLVFTDPRESAVRALDGSTLVVGESGVADRIQHFDVVAFGGEMLSFDPVSQTIVRIGADGVLDSREIEDEAWTFPLVVDDERVWVARTAYDLSLSEVASIDTAGMVVAAGYGWIIGIEDRDLVVWAADSLEEAGRLSAYALRAPPFETEKDRLDPLRFELVDDETLLIGNTFRGTLELRTLPALTSVGGEQVVALGSWAAIEGLR